MAKIPNFPLILIAPVVSAELAKKNRKSIGIGKADTAKKPLAVVTRSYTVLISLLMFAFISIIYLGWISWLVLLSFIFGCLLLNGYYILKISSKFGSRKIVKIAEVIDWKNILSDQVMQPTSSSNAPPGFSEDFFSVYLARYFDGIVFAGETFAIPDSTFQYSSDFSIVLPDGLSIIIEIDEPYYYKDGTPTHCIDRSKDNNRNEFFLAGAWSIIRFAEEQIVLNPEGCCLEIAIFLFELTQDQQYVERFARTVCPVMEVRCWTYGEAEVMAKGNYRDRYLLKSGVKQGFSR
jgi:hypothetical protein